MNTFIKVILATIITIILIDFIGFTAWILSGQIPPDNAFIGVITKTLLKIIL